MTSRFTAIPVDLPGPVLLERRAFSDERGYLTRLFDAGDLEAFGWDGPLMQVNETGTRFAGTVRGLHFQHPPHAEIKLVTCTAGRILDIAVDLRRGSPTFLRHVAVELSAENRRSFLIPRGFAHGFQALTDDVHLVYCHSAPHRAEAEGGLQPEDPALGIAWPLPVIGLSPRDRAHPLVTSDFTGVSA